MGLIKLSLRDVVKEVRVLSAHDVVVGSVLVDGENSIGFLDKSEFLSIGSATSSNIRMVHLDSRSVSFLNLFRSSSGLNVQYLIMAVLSRHVLGHSSKVASTVLLNNVKE